MWEGGEYIELVARICINTPRKDKRTSNQVGIRREALRER